MKSKQKELNEHLRTGSASPIRLDRKGVLQLVQPFNEEIYRRGWEMICKHMKSGRKTLIKEFYANMGDKKNLTCYVRGRWVPFGERAHSQLFKLKEGGDYSKIEKLQKNPYFEKITKELTGGKGERQSIRTISHAYINRGDLIEVSKVWFYFINYVLKPSKHVFTLRQDYTILLYVLVKGYEINV